MRTIGGRTSPPSPPRAAASSPSTSLAAATATSRRRRTPMRARRAARKTGPSLSPSATSGPPAERRGPISQSTSCILSTARRTTSSPGPSSCATLAKTSWAAVPKGPPRSSATRSAPSLASRRPSTSRRCFPACWRWRRTFASSTRRSSPVFFGLWWRLCRARCAATARRSSTRWQRRRPCARFWSRSRIMISRPSRKSSWSACCGHC
mmetsp:Transcript_21711/g.73584  ORF Transcript_21711/g.73584 Transcript_21711/m.73584 type:complete len:208 (+) Transcript_21711:269-892(+)